MTRHAALAYDVRPYRMEDEPRVLELLRTALGPGPAGERTSAFFRWKHQENPFGPSFMLVAESGERIIGLRAFLRWRFRSGDRSISAVQAVDTATHPEYQGRGIFSALTREALDALSGQIELVYNTPNDQSLPGYLKMGWEVVGTLPIWVRVRRPLRFLRGIRSRRAGSSVPGHASVTFAESAAEVLARDDLTVVSGRPGEPPSWSTPRSIEFLRWRYAEAPHLNYRAVVVQGEEGPAGLAIFRIRSRGRLSECAISECIVPGGSGADARRLLRGVVAAAPADHLVCHVPRGSALAGAAARAAFVKAPGGVRFVCKQLRDGLEPDPARLDSWSLSLGDMEVF